MRGIEIRQIFSHWKFNYKTTKEHFDTYLIIALTLTDFNLNLTFGYNDI